VNKIIYYVMWGFCVVSLIFNLIDKEWITAGWIFTTIAWSFNCYIREV